MLNKQERKHLQAQIPQYPNQSKIAADRKTKKQWTKKSPPTMVWNGRKVIMKKGQLPYLRTFRI